MRAAEHLRITGFGVVVIAFFILLSVSNASAQREAAGGGYAKAYEGAGSSAAAQTVRKNVGGALQKAAARARAKRNAAAAAAKRQTAASRPAPSRQASPAPRSVANTSFRPVRGVNTLDALAESIGTTPEEKVLLKQIFAATKTAFAQEVAAKGRPNNISAAFTFFIGTMAMVYHDDPEPSEEALDNLWDGLDEVLAELPEMSQMSDRDKQEMYDTLISFSGLVLAGYMNGKETNDPATQQAYRLLAGSLIQTVLQISPDEMRFGRDGLNIGS